MATSTALDEADVAGAYLLGRRGTGKQARLDELEAELRRDAIRRGVAARARRRQRLLVRWGA
ncbi:hypothetical protein [Motilibacter deserti]|uniref:Uncharacterized protein n=1 Tax=Motilibacter deserti TaxID=2714956 RepID=A0ABX0GSG6_9ACTN|nr:hypothetical protein [Motilibacter deserti]NHC13828.1 hypothetical protein [Motilibacter deserti]